MPKRLQDLRNCCREVSGRALLVTPVAMDIMDIEAATGDDDDDDDDDGALSFDQEEAVPPMEPAPDRMWI